MEYKMIDLNDIRFYARPAGPSIDDRLWARVVKGDASECWPWTAGKSSAGYGRINWQGKAMYAHQLAYIETFGPVPKGAELDHTCHNNTGCVGGPACPHRACCNPAHLEAVPHKINAGRGNLAESNRKRRKKPHHN